MKYVTTEEKRQKAKRLLRKKAAYIADYYRRFPWKKHLQYTRARARKEGIFNTLTIEQALVLWQRDKAHKLKEPSIDRIKPELGYVYENCRFIEMRENARLGSIHRTKNHAEQREAVHHLKKWVPKGRPRWAKNIPSTHIPKIRRLYTTGLITYNELAKAFDLPKNTVITIIRSKIK